MPGTASTRAIFELKLPRKKHIKSRYHRKIIHRLERISENFFSKPRGVHTTQRVALERPRRYLSKDASLGACTLSVVEEISLEIRASGGVLSCVLYDTRT